MFSVYQKITTPESSPTLGPILGPIQTTNATTINAPEPFALSNYCCSHRKSNGNNVNNDNGNNDNGNSNNSNNSETINNAMIGKTDKQLDLDVLESKYSFGHATHYTYRVTTPRILCDFETGTPPLP